MYLHMYIYRNICLHIYRVMDLGLRIQGSRPAGFSLVVELVTFNLLVVSQSRA